MNKEGAMDKSIDKDVIVDYLNIVLGAIFVAFSTMIFFKPAGIVIGGVSGLSIIVEQLTGSVMDEGIPVWLTNIVMNIPLFILGAKVIGKKFFRRSLFGFIVSTIVFYFLGYVNLNPIDEFLITIIGSVGVGLGVALANKSSGSLGGTELLAVIIKKYYPHIPVNKILMYIDVVIITVGIYIFGVEKGLYALIAAYLVGKTFGAVLEGLTFAKTIYIVTSNPIDVSKELMEKLNRGVTGLHGTGMYTKQDKTVLFTVIAPRQITMLKKITEEIDENAFIIITDAKEVLGYGFDKKVPKKNNI